jgi:hypothetical protein
MIWRQVVPRTIESSTSITFQRYRVEFLAYRLLALALAGHDKRAADVAVLHQALAELDAQFMRHRLGGDTAGIGNGDNHVDVQVGAQAANLPAQGLALAHARLVNGNLVHE